MSFHNSAGVLLTFLLFELLSHCCPLLVQSMYSARYDAECSGSYNVNMILYLSQWSYIISLTPVTSRSVLDLLYNASIQLYLQNMEPLDYITDSGLVQDK